jgi:hypothetical protein
MAKLQVTINKIATHILVKHAFDLLTEEEKDQYIECQDRVKILISEYGNVGIIAVCLTGREFELGFIE